MDLRLSAEQELIRATAREFLESECPMAHVRAMQRDSQGYSPELWGKMAELGWTGLPFAEEHGGAGMSFLDLCLLIEEQGRCRLPAPFFPTVVLCGLPIARFGTAAQQREHLEAMAAGRRVMTYAEAEPGAPWEPAAVEMAAGADGDGYVLDGAKLFVPYAHVADYLLVAARTGGSGEEGLTLFLVDAGAAGVTSRPLETIARDHQHEVVFDGVRVPADHVLGRVGEGWPIVRAIHEWGAAAKCAEILGGAQKVLEMTVAFATKRVQFDRPIGSFQAVQHHCANMAMDVVGSRFLAYEAIWRLSEGLDAAHQVAMAKSWASEAYQRVCARGHQVHGAIGFTEEDDLQLYSRHAKAAELAFGDGDYHCEQVARHLGL